MSNMEKPLDLQSDTEKATKVFEDILDPKEDNLEATNDEVAEDLVEETESEETETPEEESLEYEEEFEEDEATDESYEDEIEADNEEELYAIKVDGEEIQVTFDELKSGYSRQKDYTKKTQELSEERKSLEEKARQNQQRELEMSEEKALYEELLPKMKRLLETNMKQEPDWQKLIDSDPQEYLRQKEAWSKQGDTLKFVEAEMERSRQEQIQQQQKILEEQSVQAKKIIADRIPEWSDEKIAQKEVNEIMDYAKTLGFTNDELSEVYDGRLVLLLRDGWLHSKTKKAVKTKPKESPSRKVVKPGTSNRIKTNAPLRKAKEKLKKSGSIKDATEVFENLL